MWRSNKLIGSNGLPVVMVGRGSQRIIDSIGLSLPGILCGHGRQRMIALYWLIFTRNIVWAWQSEDDWLYWLILTRNIVWVWQSENDWLYWLILTWNNVWAWQSNRLIDRQTAGVEASIWLPSLPANALNRNGQNVEHWQASVCVTTTKWLKSTTRVLPTLKGWFCLFVCLFSLIKKKTAFKLPNPTNEVNKMKAKKQN